MEDSTQEQAKTFIDYEFGDLYVKCSCGHDTLIKKAKGIEGGIRFDLYTISSAELLLECEECKHTMSLIFKEAEDIFNLKEEKAKKEAEINQAILDSIQEAEEVKTEDKEEDGNNESV